MPHASPTHAGVLPPPELVATARRFVDTSGGLQPAAKTLGVGRQALAALLAGVRVRRGTIVLVAQGLGWPGATAPAPERVA